MNMFLGAVVEVISNLLAIPLVDRAGRRFCEFSSEVSAGVLCILMVYIPKGKLLNLCKLFGLLKKPIYAEN